MAITTVDGWFAAAKQSVLWRKIASATSIAAIQWSVWNQNGSPGAGTLSVANSTTGVLYTDATAGAPLLTAFGGGATGYLARGVFRNSVAGGCVLYDRIFGCSPTNLTSLATTTLSGQPSITGRLPGGNDYGNLEILIEIATTMSASATTISVTYTNQAGTTGRTTGASASLSGFTAGRVISLPLQAGDQGVQKIEAIVVGGATNAAGVISVILARRLAEFDVRVVNGMDAQAWDLIGGPVVFDTTCFWPVIQPDSTSTGLPTLSFNVING